MIQLASEPAWIFQSDWFRITNIWLVAATNGYNVAAVMLYGPQQVKDTDKERAGIIMNLHLLFGVCLGTMISAFGMERIHP